MFLLFYILYSVLLFQFPEVDLACLLIQLQIAVITGLFDLSRFQGIPNCAARFFPMCAVVKTAAANILSEIRKCVLQIFLKDNVHLIRIKGGEARRICHIGIFSQPVQFYMAGSMPAAAQLFRNFAGRQFQLRTEPVQNTALAHTAGSRSHLFTHR